VHYVVQAQQAQQLPCKGVSLVDLGCWGAPENRKEIPKDTVEVEETKDRRERDKIEREREREERDKIE